MNRLGNNRTLCFAILTITAAIVLPGCGCSEDEESTGGTEEEVVGFTISDPDARACEWLLKENESVVDGVAFDDGTTGTYVREAPHVAVTFHSNSDAKIGTLELSLQGSDVPEQASVRCFDADGETLDGVTIDES